MHNVAARILCCLMLGVSYALIASGCQAAAKDAVWTVRMFDQAGGKRPGKRFSVRSEALYVDFNEPCAWTILNIKYHNDEIVGEHGYNGSVASARPKKGSKRKSNWIGTGHGFETVKSLSIVVDGRPYKYKQGDTVSGKTVVIRKESNLGPLDHRSEITLEACGDRIIETHSYKVIEDLSKRFHYLYAFMHCNNNALDQWLAVTEGDKELTGTVGKGDKSFSLKSDVRVVIFYSEAMKKGVAYVYPEVYKGRDTFKNSIWDRKNDNKLYFRPEVKKMGYQLGDTFEYRLTVIPFSAEPGQWKQKGKQLANSIRTPKK